MSPVLSDKQKGDREAAEADPCQPQGRGQKTPNASTAVCSILRPTMVPRGRTGFAAFGLGKQTF